MTIKEVIDAKLRRAKLVAFLFWLAFAATIFIPREGNTFFLSLIPFAGFGATVLYIMYFIKCPRCGASLGRTSMMSANPFRKKSGLNYCPNCGVSLDENI